MNASINRLLREVDETKLLIVVFAAVFFGALLAIWAANRHRKNSQHVQQYAAKNVVPMHRPRAQRKANPRKALRSRKASNPLWLVAVAIILAVLFRTDIWWEIAPHQKLTGVVTHVRDGDTIEVSGRAIRLNGLTCDERRTPLGDKATAAMKQLVSGRSLTCELNGDRTYDREVGRCSLIDDRTTPMWSLRQI